jgi:hypothetical protein
MGGKHWSAARAPKEYRLKSNLAVNYLLSRTAGLNIR